MASPPRPMPARSMCAMPKALAFRVVFTDAARRASPSRLRLPMPGEHNVQNALAAIAVARELGVSDDAIRKGAGRVRAACGAASPRSASGTASAIIDDYAHNPFKIAAALKAARQAYRGPVIAVVQPHRYTRLRDTVRAILQLPQRRRCRRSCADVYAAGEPPIDGIGPRLLAEALRAHGHRECWASDGRTGLAGWWRNWPRPATWWSAWAPAPSPPGSTPSRKSWRPALMS